MTAVMGEARWWGGEFRDLVVRHPWLVVLWVLALVGGWWWVPARIVLIACAIAWVLGRLWVRFSHGRTLQDHKVLKQQAITSRSVAQSWPALMDRLGISLRRVGPSVEVPVITELRWDAGFLFVRVSIPLGLTRATLQANAEVIAENLGANAARVFPAPAGALVRLEFQDRLERSFTLPLADTVDLTAIPMGLRDDGAVWSMRLGPHTLVAGCSGSGKASLVWGLLLGIGPALHDGTVQVHGIDLKGAMELGMGPALLTRMATSAEEAVQVLEDAVREMQGRARMLSGVTRQHVATHELPHVVVLIDEIAALTAYLPDRDLTRRANAALAMLCSQGRAVGYTVFACLQDPRKETIPTRGLFTQAVGLRLRDAMETAMVLGEGMRDRGALCDRIPASSPGVAFVVPEDGSDPQRVRARFVPDEQIREANDVYAAATTIPIAVPHDADRSSRSRRGRADRSRAAAKEAEQ